MKQYKVYTDGACSGNPGPGGWGVAIVYDDNIDKFNGFDPETKIEDHSSLNLYCHIDIDPLVLF